ncbi:hypothetical protein [Nostoc sp.]|uniref:hypothetical protein n=1 Tax=Nostoc sp. TaxID=1180 RepID=UPI002FFC6D3A
MPNKQHTTHQTSTPSAVNRCINNWLISASTPLGEWCMANYSSISNQRSQSHID